MTREEREKAIKWIKENPFYHEDHKPFNIMLEALEQKPKILEILDFAIDASNGDTNYFVGFRNGIRYAKSLIDGEEEPYFESCVEKESKWIPVDYDRYPDTYPKPFQEVWITDGYAEVKHRPYDGTRNIKAWMPYVKPEPYEVESEE